MALKSNREILYFITYKRMDEKKIRYIFFKLANRLDLKPASCQDNIMQCNM